VESSGKEGGQILSVVGLSWLLFELNPAACRLFDQLISIRDILPEQERQIGGREPSLRDERDKIMRNIACHHSPSCQCYAFFILFYSRQSFLKLISFSSHHEILVELKQEGER